MDRDFSEIRSDFLTWLKEHRVRKDQDKYLIDGLVSVDYFIRFEKLLEGLAEVCQRLGIERDIAELGRFKSDSRLTDRHFSEFYDREAQAIVAEAYAFELDHFGAMIPAAAKTAVVRAAGSNWLYPTRSAF